MSRCGQPPGGGAWALSYPVPVLRGPSLTLPPPPNGYRRLRGSGPGAVEPVCSRVVVGGPGGNNPVTSLQTHRFPWGGLQLKVFQAARLSSSGRPLQRFPAPFGVVPVRSPSGWGGGGPVGKGVPCSLREAGQARRGEGTKSRKHLVSSDASL